MLPTLDTWPSKIGLRLGHLNVCHARNKAPHISSLLSNSGQNFHIFGFTESRLTENDFNDFKMDGYHYPIIREPKLNKETGILVYINNSVKYERMEKLESSFIESVWIKVFLKIPNPC